jgi:hypothetical protein
MKNDEHLTSNTSSYLESNSSIKAFESSHSLINSNEHNSRGVSYEESHSKVQFVERLSPNR